MTERKSKGEQRPPACDVLSEILAEGGDAARAIRERFHATMVSRWKHAKRLPDTQSAIVLDEITDGRLAVRLWKLPELDQSAA